MTTVPNGARPDSRQSEFRPGETAFNALLFLAGLFFFLQSLALWLRMERPRVASAAALPLLVSALWALLSLTTTIENLRKAPRRVAGGATAPKLDALRYAFPQAVLVALAAIAAYCALLFVGAGFFAATPLFLFALMCYLTRANYASNLLYTALVMAFVVLVFRVLLGVVLP